MNKLNFFLILSIVFFYVVQVTETLVLKRRGNLSFNGRATHYSAGPGSCGKNDADDEMIVALNQEQMENGLNPNENPHCGKMIKITGKSGNTHKARIVDTCPQCSEGSLDLSPALFEKVCGKLEQGVCEIDWDFE